MHYDWTGNDHRRRVLFRLGWAFVSVTAVFSVALFHYV